MHGLETMEIVLIGGTVASLVLIPSITLLVIYFKMRNAPTPDA